jgi:hypothetical protein
MSQTPSDDINLSTKELANLLEIRKALALLNKQQVEDCYVKFSLEASKYVALLNAHYAEQLRKRDDLIAQAITHCKKQQKEIRQLTLERDTYKDGYLACLNFLIDSENSND